MMSWGKKFKRRMMGEPDESVDVLDDEVESDPPSGDVSVDDVLHIAKVAARRYANRCWWADLQDMTSEAAQAVLQAKLTWDPQVGVPFDSYAYRAALLRVRKYLWRQSSPVSGGLHDPERTIAGLRKKELDNDSSYGRLNADPGELMDEAEWRLRVRRRIRALSRDVEHADLVAEVLVHGRDPRELLAETGKDVRGAVRQVRRRLREDKRAYRLFKSLVNR